ncbi:ABC transporter ATP-binding protein [Rhizobium leguminosarum]|uniref:ABC transporter ATP-binding protein n=1 Tax=Rhizobium leguminosarum TaxID=384 RepID=UPI001FE23977|nr:ABC transporter ATP-binding protein [Rhizobium leguminosarum]
MNGPILEVQNFTMRFGGIVANRDVSFSVERGAVTALIGPNGAGKTTMFNCITGFYRSSEGRIMLNGSDGPTDIGQLVTKPMTGGSHLVTRAGIARTFQNIRLFKGMSVIENLLIAQHLATRNNILSGVFRTRAFRKAEAEAVDRAYHWLGQMKLAEDANRLAGELPYGRQRRVEIARAMCTGPSLICLDEPAAGLNPSETLDLAEVIQRLCTDHKQTVLVIEHDMGLVKRYQHEPVVRHAGTASRIRRRSCPLRPGRSAEGGERPYLSR